MIIDFMEEIANDVFESKLRNSNALLITMKSKDGNNNKTTIGKNSSSRTLAADSNLPDEILLKNTKKNNLVRTKIAAAPSTNPNVKFNSALRTLASNGEVDSCEYSTGDRSDECRDSVELSAQKSSKESSAPKVESKVMLISKCEASTEHVEGAGSSSGNGEGNGNFFQSKIVKSIGISHPDTLK